MEEIEAVELAGKELERTGYTVTSAKDFQAFLNPQDEVYNDLPPGLSPNKLLERVAEAYIPKEPDSNNEIEPPPLVSIDEALNSLQRLQLYMEQGEIKNEVAHQHFDQMNSQLLQQRLLQQSQGLRQLTLPKLLKK